MADSLVFNTSAFSAVSKWLEHGTASREDTTHPEDATGPQDMERDHTREHSTSRRLKRAGVGLAFKKDKDRQGNAAGGSMSTLQKLLRGNSRPGKRPREKEDDEATAKNEPREDSAEDDGEVVDSKAHVFASKQSSLPRASIDAVACTQTGDSKKKKRRKKKEGDKGERDTNANEEKTGQDVADAKSPHNVLSASSKKGKPCEESRAPTAQAAPPDPANDGAHRPSTTETRGIENRHGSNQAPRRRTKTRSKQKNIRRDTRCLEDRPAHLQEGHTAFAGRTLTEETKRRLATNPMAPLKN